MLFDLLSKGTSPSTENPHARPSWDKRKALVGRRDDVDSSTCRTHQLKYRSGEGEGEDEG